MTFAQIWQTLPVSTSMQSFILYFQNILVLLIITLLPKCISHLNSFIGLSIEPLQLPTRTFFFTGINGESLDPPVPFPSNLV